MTEVEKIADRFITRGEVMNMFRIKKDTLAKWRKREDFPKAKQFSSGTIRFSLKEITNWANEIPSCDG